MNSLFLTPDPWQAEVMEMRSAFGASIDAATAAGIVRSGGASQCRGSRERAVAIAFRRPGKGYPGKD
jgi:hypothetical protein